MVWALVCNPAKTAYFSAEMRSSVPGREWKCYLIRFGALYDCNRACERCGYSAGRISNGDYQGSAVNFAAEQSMFWAFRYRPNHFSYANYFTADTHRKGPHNQRLSTPYRLDKAPKGYRRTANSRTTHQRLGYAESLGIPYREPWRAIV